MKKEDYEIASKLIRELENLKFVKEEIREYVKKLTIISFNNSHGFKITEEDVAPILKKLDDHLQKRETELEAQLSAL